MLHGTPLESTKDEFELFEKAFGRLLKIDGTLKIKLDEPIVVQTILNKLEVDNSANKTKLSFLKEILASRMRHWSSPSSQGFYWELFLGLAFIELRNEDWSRLFGRVVNLHLKVKCLRQPKGAVLSTSNKYSLFEWLQQKPTTFYMPHNFAGPDLVFFVETEAKGPVVVFAQFKFAIEENWENAFATTDPLNFFTYKTGKLAGKVVSTHTKEYESINAAMAKVEHIGLLVSYPVSFSKVKQFSYFRNRNRFQVLIDSRNIHTLVESKYLMLFNNLKNKS